MQPFNNQVMKKLLFTLLLLAFYNLNLMAASLYVLYDDACMDRLEYIYQNSDSDDPYVVYHIKTNPGEKIILEVGTESTTAQDFLPAQFIRCNNAVFDETLVNAINSNIDRVFMVVKKGKNRYFISPITFAARYLRADDYLLYDSPKYRFLFDMRLGTIGENIAYKNPNVVVNFEGKLENICTGEYIFRQKNEFAGNPHTDIILVPEVGIIEERSGINAADAIKNTIRLSKVNGKKLDRHLRKICTGEDIGPDDDELTARQIPDQSEQVITYDQVSTTFLGSSTTPQERTTPIEYSNDDGIHKVQKGETLYRISKNYGVTVEQLRAWNNKGNSNTIYVGEQLKVSPDGAPSEGRSDVRPLKEYNVLGKRLGTSSTTTSSKEVLTSKQATGPGRHTVKRGETIASIARTYGYTEARFRAINNIAANEYIKLGQVLKTSDCDCPEYEQPNYRGPVDYGNTSGPVNPGLNSRSPELTDLQQSTRPYYSSSSNTNNESFDNENFDVQNREDQYRNTPYFLDRPSGYANEQPRNTQPSYRQNTQTQQYSSDRTTPYYGNNYNEQSYNNSGYSSQNNANTGQNSEFYTVQPNGNRNQQQTTTAYGNDEFYTVQPKSPQQQPKDAYRVPDSAMPGYTPSPQSYYTPSARKDNGNRTVYIVREGDTLYGIATKYGMSIEQLRSINNLEREEILIPYQKIYLN
jgi:LysM repeat protein